MKTEGEGENWFNWQHIQHIGINGPYVLFRHYLCTNILSNVGIAHSSFVVIYLFEVSRVYLRARAVTALFRCQVTTDPSLSTSDTFKLTVYRYLKIHIDLLFCNCYPQICDPIVIKSVGLGQGGFTILEGSVLVDRDTGTHPFTHIYYCISSKKSRNLFQTLK